MMTAEHLPQLDPWLRDAAELLPLPPLPVDHDHAGALDRIDQTLDALPLTIEQAVLYRVVKGDMTMDEARECIAAYERSFGLHEAGE